MELRYDVQELKWLMDDVERTRSDFGSPQKEDLQTIRTIM